MAACRKCERERFEALSGALRARKLAMVPPGALQPPRPADRPTNWRAKRITWSVSSRRRAPVTPQRTIPPGPRQIARASAGAASPTDRLAELCCDVPASSEAMRSRSASPCARKDRARCRTHHRGKATVAVAPAEEADREKELQAPPDEATAPSHSAAANRPAKSGDC